MRPTFTFDEIYHQNQKRIYYHIHKLNIKDPHHEFYQIGLESLWLAYQTYNPQKGPMSTYFNFIIRNRLIDQIRKNQKQKTIPEKHLTAFPERLSHFNSTIETIHHLDREKFNQKIKNYLTQNQWKWFNTCVLHDKSLHELAIQENMTLSAVKSWARQGRKKLRTEKVQTIAKEELRME